LRDRISQLRIQKGVSEYQMSLELGHSRGYIQNISSGKSLPSVEGLFEICDYFEITREKDAINTALEIIRKLDSDYTHNGFWTMNSKFSASAKFARITITKDSTTPSHIGEAYQAISRLKRTLQIPTISPVEQKIRTITKSFIPSAEHEHASIKLAEID